MMGELSNLLLSLAGKIEELAEQQKKLNEDAGEEAASPWTYEAVMHLYTMMASDSESVRKRGAFALGKLASCSPRAKQEATNVPELFPKLMEMIRLGCLEGIDAVASLSFENPLGCDKIRDSLPECGAITMLAGFINTSTEDNAEDAAAKAAGADRVKNALDPEGRKRKVGPGKDDKGSATKMRDLADLGEVLIPGMSAAKDAIDPDKIVRPTIVPVRSKAEAVTALRNIATSNETNREAITRQQVIPQLVKLMTQMKIEDDNKSAQSGQSGNSAPSVDSNGNKKKERRKAMGDTSGKKKQEVDPATREQVLNRKQLALENRKLAESAGQMLHTLIMDGTEAIKKIIISAIISTVQQPGSKPPRDVPQLMNILKSAAEEQLEMVQRGDDYGALNLALDFGRWIGLRTIKLGEARNVFKMQQEEKKKEDKERQRRAELGLSIGDELPPEVQQGKASGAQAAAAGKNSAAGDGDKQGRLNTETAKERAANSTAVLAERKLRQQKRDAKKDAQVKAAASRAMQERAKERQTALALLTQSGKDNTRAELLNAVAKVAQLEARRDMKSRKELEEARLQAGGDPDERPTSPTSWHYAWLQRGGFADDPGLPPDLWERSNSVLPKGRRTDQVDAETHFQAHEAYQARMRQLEERQLNVAMSRSGSARGESLGSSRNLDDFFDA